MNRTGGLWEVAPTSLLMPLNYSGEDRLYDIGTCYVMAGSGTYVYSRAEVDLKYGDSVVAGNIMSQLAASVIVDRKSILCPTLDFVKKNQFQFGYAENDELGKFKISGNSQGNIPSKFMVYLYDSIPGDLNRKRDYNFTLTKNPYSVCQTGEGTEIGTVSFNAKAGEYFWLKTA